MSFLHFNPLRLLRDVRELLPLVLTERRRERNLARGYVCPHSDYLCDKYGCPDDPTWKGDGCR